MPTWVERYSRIERWLGALASAMALALALDTVSCGGSKSPAEQAGSEESAIESPPPSFEVTMPQEVEEPADGGAAESKAEPAPSEPEKAIRRPQPTFSTDQEIATTLGESGAIIKLGAIATLRIPEGALRDGKNIRVALSSSSPSKAAPPALGPSLTLEPKLRSAGPPFEVTFSLPEGVNAVELVVPMAPDSTKKGSSKAEYRRVAPKKIDVKKKQALFELDELPGGDVYLTKGTPPPTPAKESAAPASPTGKAPAGTK